MVLLNMIGLLQWVDKRREPGCTKLRGLRGVNGSELRCSPKARDAATALLAVTILNVRASMIQTAALSIAPSVYALMAYVSNSLERVFVFWIKEAITVTTR